MQICRNMKSPLSIELFNLSRAWRSNDVSLHVIVTGERLQRLLFVEFPVDLYYSGAGKVSAIDDKLQRVFSELMNTYLLINADEHL